MARPKTKARESAGRLWLVSVLFILAIGIAFWGLNPMLQGTAWWLQGTVVTIVVLAGAAAVRSVTRRRYWGTIAAVALAIATLTVMFVASTAILGVVPTLDSLRAFRELEAAGMDDISSQRMPAEATEGIRFLICLGIAVIAVAMDALAHLARSPALAGFPLLVLLLVPGFVQPTNVDLAPFVLAAVVWLAAIVPYSGSSSPRTAIGIGAAAVAVALLVPLALPAAEQRATETSGPGTGFATGLNPLITLGVDLRRGTPTLALTYRTSDNSGQYLRLTALSDFSGESWEPSITQNTSSDLDAIGPAPGVTAEVPQSRLTTNISVEDVLSRWLPVPYAAEGISGLDGDWTWEPEGLTVRGEGANAQDQEYQVISVEPEPSVEQLVASGSGPFAELDDYLALPEDLPAVVGDTAREVTAGLGSHYESALALQAFFRSGDFTYSESAPVDGDFDGSGAEVLGPFLEQRTGYCVHFSSAMAAMARTIGIPSRVVVGFTPGEGVSTPGDEFTAYRVSTNNLHAWPELYFTGIGWVRFEPTPGRGAPPVFAPLSQDDPTTPDVDESVPPPPVTDPTAAPETETEPELAPEDTPETTAEALGPDATATPFPLAQVIAALAALVLVAPAVIRAARRARRLGAVGRGSAVDAWLELRDTTYDLGLSSDVSLTPRQLSDELAEHLDDAGIAALSSLRVSLESQAYAREPVAPAARDLRRVIASLRRVAGVPRAVGSVLAPRSLVRGWIQLATEK